MKHNLTLGSLFDGSGGFPLGACMVGIEPLWASEIEPFPIMVTSKRFPNMKHYGDITKLHGDELPPVDIITFGSPCQDMSVEGKRAGLKGKKSCLFYEAIRIIREMRFKTNGEFPRYAIWENVCGSLSSNGGEDFRCVLEAFSAVSIPRFKKRAPKAGLAMGADYSIAWRVLDAQYWGVPQRRRRLFLVADYKGQSAGKILFNAETDWSYCKPIEETEVCTGRTVYGLSNEATDGTQYAIAVGENIMPTMVAHGPGVVVTNDGVRRVTPEECAMLQGFPDWWCKDVKKNSINAQYKMWGNGVALPCVTYILEGIVNNEIL